MEILYKSTRSDAEPITASQAILAGLAPDGGLYVPTEDPSFDRLPEAVSEGNLDKAFEAAHALKGVMANLALTPILQPVQEITELLRSRTEADYAPLISEIRSQRENLMKMF